MAVTQHETKGSRRGQAIDRPVLVSLSQCTAFNSAFYGATWTMRVSFPVYIMAIQSVIGEYSSTDMPGPVQSYKRPVQAAHAPASSEAAFLQAPVSASIELQPFNIDCL